MTLSSTSSAPFEQDARRGSASSHKHIKNALNWVVGRFEAHDQNVKTAWEAALGVTPAEASVRQMLRESNYAAAAAK
jgi:hypothetical protein